MTEIPRRIDLERFTPAERAIYDAVQAVEAMAADVRLTDAVILLQAARDSVADYIDNIGPSRRYVRAGDPPIENVRLFQHRAEVVEFVKEIRGYTMLTDAVDATIRILTRSAGEAIPVSPTPEQSPGCLDAVEMCADVLSLSDARAAIRYLVGRVNAAENDLWNQPEPVSPTPDWHPIETAPKDGSWIIVRCDERLVYAVSWGRNHAGRECFCTLTGWVGLPTHWMPLPASPSPVLSPKEERHE